jgi:hypothetical protein
VTEHPQPSDQRPEEGAAEYVHEDTEDGGGTGDSPGVPGEEGTATGNPDAAGADDEDAEHAESRGEDEGTA